MEKYYRLYPEILDPCGIKAALVEGMLCRSQGVVVPTKDSVMSTFYIELHPSPGGDRSM